MGLFSIEQHGLRLARCGTHKAFRLDQRPRSGGRTVDLGFAGGDFKGGRSPEKRLGS
jgi:hypothetical protein